MDGVSGCGGGQESGGGIGGILKELMDSPMAPHNKIKNKKGGKKGGGGGGKKGGGGDQGGGGACSMIGNIAGGILG